MANKPPFTLPYAHPAVRDLAFLLTAPSPWKSGADIPPHRLLGPDGPALLQALDAHPAELRHWLARQPTQANTGTENAMRRHSRVTESTGAGWGTA